MTVSSVAAAMSPTNTSAFDFRVFASPEVEHLGLTALGNEDVGRLDIAMIGGVAIPLLLATKLQFSSEK